MFQLYVVLNGIKTPNVKSNYSDEFQLYVVLNGIKTDYGNLNTKWVFQLYVVLNGIKTITTREEHDRVLVICRSKWY